MKDTEEKRNPVIKKERNCGKVRKNQCELAIKEIIETQKHLLIGEIRQNRKEGEIGLIV